MNRLSKICIFLVLVVSLQGCPPGVLTVVDPEIGGRLWVDDYGGSGLGSIRLELALTGEFEWRDLDSHGVEYRKLSGVWGTYENPLGPNWIDFRLTDGTVWQGIYELRDGILWINLKNSNMPRPTEFDSMSFQFRDYFEAQ